MNSSLAILNRLVGLLSTTFLRGFMKISTFPWLAAVAIPVAGTALVVVGTIPRPATAQTAEPIVRLQQTTPGLTQQGHTHISGTAIAGFFKGDGSAVTGLNADNITAGLLAPAFGGLGLDTSAASAGSLLSSTGSGWSILPPDADGQVLTLVGGLPTWQNSTGFTLPYDGNGDDAGLDSLFKVNNSGVNAAIMGETSGPLGIGVKGTSTDTTTYSIGGLFTSSSPLGRGVFAQNTATTGPAIAGRFGSASPASIVVQATASSTADGDATALYGESFAISGTGVWGVATGTTASRFPVGVEGDTAGRDGAGVYGYNSATSGRSTGVYAASANVSAGSAALLVFGNSVAFGTKSFLIDDPSSPTTRNLRHYCSEGPAPYNIYKGRVTTDAQGYAWAKLPDYFASINKDPDYQLTVVDGSDDFVLAKVTREVEGNRFQIRTNKPRVVVCWEVKAIRNDKWVQTTGYSDVEEKLPNEQGKYLVPQVYGRPLSQGVNVRIAKGAEQTSTHP